jgi:hypothetical protein
VSADLDVVDVYVLTPQEAKEAARRRTRTFRSLLDAVHAYEIDVRRQMHDAAREEWALGATQDEVTQDMRCGRATADRVINNRE